MSNADDARLAGRLSIAYMMAVAAEVLRMTSLDFLDILLVTAIADVNARADAAGCPAGISRNALSRLLNVPLETVRRRVANLMDKNVLLDKPGGLAFCADNAVGLGSNAALDAFNLEKLRDLFRSLKAHGIALE